MSGDSEPTEGASRDFSQESLDLRERFAAEFRAGRRPDPAEFAGQAGERGAVMLEELVLLERLLVRAELDRKGLTEALSGDPGSSRRPGSGTSRGLGSDTAAGPDASSPPVIERFRFLELLGQGGFGSVWRALDLRLDREVAVKVSRRRAGGEHLPGLLREAQVAARLNHPNIVPVFEVAVEESEAAPAYIVTGLVNGPTLRDWARARRPGPEEAGLFVERMARAIQHAHDRGIVHRDLKPRNVLVDAAGQPQIVDFGLAKRDAGEDADGPVGTPAYMSPEQARGAASETGPASDVYSLGVILYELLAGDVPFHAGPRPLLERVIHDTPTPPRPLDDTVSGRLARVCLRCLEKDPRDRYPSASALADAVAASLSRVPPRAATRRPPAWSPLRGAAPVAVGLAIFAVCAGWYWAFGPRPGRNVEFTTSPPGCSITAVRLSDATGDPDPSLIYTSRSRTPLVMRLPPGGYLIVAVLDEGRFHEVHRHVPEIPKGDSESRTPSEKAEAADVVAARPIVIPDPSLAGGMARIEGADAWRPPSDHPGERARKLAVEPFLVEKAERLPDGKGDREKFLEETWAGSIERLEKAGMRMPSSLELLYAQDYFHSRGVSGAEVSGLYESPREWTTTRQWAAESSDPALGLSLARQITRAGSPPRMTQGGGRPLFPHQVGYGFDAEGRVATRGVRSLRPRTRAEDFVRDAD